MTCVFRYGARPPTEGAAIVDQQLWLNHRYKNKLTEIELDRRRAKKEADEGHQIVRRSIRSVTAAGEDTWEVTFACEHTQMFERVDPPKVGTTAACYTCTCPEYLQRLKEINQAACTARRHVRNHFVQQGLYWGSYGLAEQAASSAAKGKDDPNFKSWDRTGRIGMQIQSSRPLTFGQAMAGTDSRLRIKFAPDPEGCTNGSRRSGRRAVVHLRVGSNEREPVWAVWPVTLHRLPADDAVITWAVFRRERVGPEFRWFFLLTLKSVPCADPKTVEGRTGTVAVDVGWRRRPDGLRAGYWHDDAGNHGELLLPEKLREKQRGMHEIYGTRDTCFNGFLPVLIEWLHQNSSITPDWLRTDTAGLSGWKSANRLSRLAWKWLRNRFDGDAFIYEKLLAWRNQDRHLYAWATHGMNKVLGRRDEICRIWSAELARQYATVVIEKIDLRNLVGRNGIPEDATDGEKKRADKASSNRFLVAPGRFRDFLVQACKVRGTRVVKRPPEYTTIDCATCGVRVPWDPAPEIMHRCEACGAVVDQDDQACQNLLAGVSSGPVPMASVEVLEPRLSARQRAFRRAKIRQRDGTDG